MSARPPPRTFRLSTPPVASTPPPPDRIRPANCATPREVMGARYRRRRSKSIRRAAERAGGRRAAGRAPWRSVGRSVGSSSPRHSPRSIASAVSPSPPRSRRQLFERPRSGGTTPRRRTGSRYVEQSSSGARTGADRAVGRPASRPV